MCLRRGSLSPENLQVLQRGQVVNIAIHPKALRTDYTAYLDCQYCLLHWCAQWNGFVELLPLWLAPNMVTLLGFFFILGNVALLEIFVPDFVGPVCVVLKSCSHIWYLAKLTVYD